jgi:hypothetical protein
MPENGWVPEPIWTRQQGGKPVPLTTIEHRSPSHSPVTLFTKRTQNERRKHEEIKNNRKENRKICKQNLYNEVGKRERERKSKKTKKNRERQERNKAGRYFFTNLHSKEVTRWEMKQRGLCWQSVWMSRQHLALWINLALSLRRTVKVGLVTWRHKKGPAFWLGWLLFLASLVSFFRRHKVRAVAGAS